MHDKIFTTYTELKERVAEAHEKASPDKEVHLVGLLFMREGQQITDKDIVPSLDYFDARSGQDMHFFLPGWHRESEHSSAGNVISWHFELETFVKACEFISRETLWKYSGGVDLLLFTTTKMGGSGAVIDFGGAITLPLHEMRDKKLESPEVLFERLFSFARNYKGDRPLSALALQEARVSIVWGLIEAVVGYLPKETKERVEYAKHFAIQDVSKPNPSKQAVIRRGDAYYITSNDSL